MDVHVADSEFTDGVWRQVYQDRRGQQHVLAPAGGPKPR
jgi:hypothetical protein